MKRIGRKLLRGVRCLLTSISPALNTRFNYFLAHRRWLHLNPPRTFEEKLLWLKLRDYNSNPLVARCADKYCVRDYVQEKGCAAMLNTLLGAYDTVEEIPWDALPERFVLKWNFGCGMNLIVHDKSKLDIAQATEKLRRWGKSKYWLPFAEMQYKDTPKKLLCEAFLEDNAQGKSLTDYKVYCFHGEPLVTAVFSERGTALKVDFFDQQWRALPNTTIYPSPEEPVKRPACLEEMLETARKLSAPFPFVRCDFYVVDGQPVFGEMTFTPAGGLYVVKTTLDGKDLSDLLHIPAERKAESK